MTPRENGPPVRRWETLPWFILRSTGFAFDLIEVLAFPETTSAVDALIECENDIEQLRVIIQSRLRGRDAGTIALRRWVWKAVNERRAARLREEDKGGLHFEIGALIEEWDGLTVRRDRLEESARAVFDRELPERRQALRGIVTTGAFQEAVWTSSPQMCEHGIRPYLEGWQLRSRPGDVRRLERQLVCYLQRFCARNETTSFFGPVNYGDFRPSGEEHLAGPGGDSVLVRRAIIAYWAVQALAEAVARDADVAPYLRPHRLPLARFREPSRELDVAGRLHVILSPKTASVLMAMDGERSVEAIASLCRISVDDVQAELARLVRFRAIGLAPLIPVTSDNPIDSLCGWVERLPARCPGRARWIEILEAFRELAGQFAITLFPEKRRIFSELERLFFTHTRRNPRRAGGGFYADRLLIYEECLGGMSPLSLGPVFAAELRTQLEPLLDLCATIACEKHERLARFGSDLLNRWSAEGRMPLLDFLRLWRREKMEFLDHPTIWHTTVLAVIQAVNGAREIRISPGDLPPYEHHAQAVLPLAASPDVMLMADNVEALRKGDFQVVLSECHDTFLLWGWALSLHPERGKVKAEAEQLLRRLQGGSQLVTMLTSQRAKTPPLEFPGATIEFMAPSAARPADERIPIRDVDIHGVDGRVLLTAPNRPSILLHNGGLHTPAHNMFSLPRVIPPDFDAGRHTPRIVLGKAVLQRERWRVSRRDLFPKKCAGTSFELMHEFRRAVRKLGLPRYVFVSIPGEPKPVFVDTGNYFLIEVLHSLVPKRADVRIVEMLPPPPQLWLKKDSLRFCSELRLSACCVPGLAVANTPAVPPFSTGPVVAR